MDECIFCRIGAGTLPAKVVYRDDRAIAIEDLNPQAPTHVLVMPLAHHEDIAQLSNSDAELAAHLIGVASQLGNERGRQGGFRLVFNTGADGGQTVAHVHVHVLAGRRLAWPPG